MRRCGAGGIAAWAEKGRRRWLRRRAEFEVRLLSGREAWRIRNGYPYTEQRLIDAIGGVREMEGMAEAVIRAQRANVVRDSFYWPGRRIPEWRATDKQRRRLGWGVR